MDVKCPLCGYRFNTRDVTNLCDSCPLHTDCNKACCPNCHYSWLESSSIVGGILGFFKKGKRVGRS